MCFSCVEVAKRETEREKEWRATQACRGVRVKKKICKQRVRHSIGRK